MTSVTRKPFCLSRIQLPAHLSLRQSQLTKSTGIHASQNDPIRNISWSALLLMAIYNHRGSSVLSETTTGDVPSRLPRRNLLIWELEYRQSDAGGRFVVDWIVQAQFGANPKSPKRFVWVHGESQGSEPFPCLNVTVHYAKTRKELKRPKKTPDKMIGWFDPYDDRSAGRKDDLPPMDQGPLE